jgi:cytochrome P450
MDAIASEDQRKPWTMSTSISLKPQLSKTQFSRNAVINCLEKSEADEERNILRFLQRATDPETGAKLSFYDLVVNSDILLWVENWVLLTGSIAGAGTTAVSMTFGIYYIISNKKVWDRLSREIRSKFNNIEDITGQSTATLTYLDAVIHESKSPSSIEG